MFRNLLARHRPNDTRSSGSQNTGPWTCVARVIASCCLAITLTACEQEVTLQNGLHDTDANEIVALLSHVGIEVKKISGKDGVSLTVSDTDIAHATDVMRAAGLPKRSLSSLGDMFKKDGMISTPLEERIRYIHGLSEELEF